MQDVSATSNDSDLHRGLVLITPYMEYKEDRRNAQRKISLSSTILI